MRGLVVKWLSRLPVTEEIAGSSPVEPASESAPLKSGVFLLVDPLLEAAQE